MATWLERRYPLLRRHGAGGGAEKLAEGAERTQRRQSTPFSPTNSAEDPFAGPLGCGYAALRRSITYGSLLCRSRRHRAKRLPSLVQGDVSPQHSHQRRLMLLSQPRAFRAVQGRPETGPPPRRRRPRYRVLPPAVRRKAGLPVALLPLPRAVSQRLEGATRPQPGQLIQSRHIIPVCGQLLLSGTPPPLEAAPAVVRAKRLSRACPLSGLILVAS